MWCRCEQLCFVLRRGTTRLWLASAPDEIKPVAENKGDWLEDNLYVFEGEATDERDKVHLMPPVLGLYAKLYAEHLAQKERAQKESSAVALAATGSAERGIEPSPFPDAGLTDLERAKRAKRAEPKSEGNCEGHPKSAYTVAAAAEQLAEQALGTALGQGKMLGATLEHAASSTISSTKSALAQLVGRQVDQHASATSLYATIEQDKDRIFPREIQVHDTAARRALLAARSRDMKYNKVRRGATRSFKKEKELQAGTRQKTRVVGDQGKATGQVETIRLFGDLVARLEKMLLEDRELRDSLSSALLEPGGHEGSAESFGNEHFSA